VSALSLYDGALSISGYVTGGKQRVTTLDGIKSEEELPFSSPSTTSDNVNGVKNRVSLWYLLSVLGVIVSSAVAVAVSLKANPLASVSLALSSSESNGWLVLRLSREGIPTVTQEADLPGNQHEL
jgi:hypothetical protein